MSVINSEIDKFDNLAKYFWDRNGPLKALHQMNPKRIEFIKKYHNLKEGSILDYGCGGGILSESLAKEGVNVMGIDLSSEGISAANKEKAVSGSDVCYRLISGNDLIKTHKESFSLVCCLEMLEHVSDIYSVIKDAATLTKPGGVLVFSTLNRTIKAKILGIKVAEAIGFAPKGAHDFKLFIKPSELVDACDAAGLIPKGIEGIVYSPFKNNFNLSIEDLSINYIAAFKKPRKNNE